MRFGGAAMPQRRHIRRFVHWRSSLPKCILVALESHLRTLE
jgi:hypothetical protein